MLFKPSVHEVTRKCHQALMHSLSSNLSKIKLTITWIMLRQCTEWILLVVLIPCQVRISCWEVQWGFLALHGLFFSAFLYIYTESKFQICDFLGWISHNLNILLSPLSISAWPQLSWNTCLTFKDCGIKSSVCVPLFFFFLLVSYHLYLNLPKSKSLSYQ